MYDLVSLGEGMLRLMPPPFERLRRARTLDVQVCGSQGNVACDLARLGHRTAFVTKVPDNPLGLLVRDFYMSCGVDVTHIRTVPDSRLGVNFLEFGATPRASASVYDRRNSAASALTPDEYDWDALLRGVRVAYTDGIFPALTENCRAATREFLSAARRQGCLVGFDINFRQHLWTAEEAGAALGELAGGVDVLISTRGDAQTVFGLAGEPEAVARQLHERFGCRTVALTLGRVDGVLRGAVGGLLLHQGQVARSREYEVDAIDRFGAGDAFGAGLLHSLLTGRDPAAAVEFAAAMCALDFTAPGDVAHVTVAEVEAVMAAKGYHVQR